MKAMKFLRAKRYYPVFFKPASSFILQNQIKRSGIAPANATSFTFIEGHYTIFAAETNPLPNFAPWK